MVEYLASFWNAEAVQKIVSARKDKEDNRFLSDEDFSEHVRKNPWNDDDIVNAIKNKYKNTNLDDINRAAHRGAREIRLPENKQSIFNMIRDEE